MKNIICSAVLILAAIVFYPHTITKAQPRTTSPSPDTLQTALSVESGRITVIPDSLPSKAGDFVQFVTSADAYSFKVIIDNYDHFIDSPSDFVTFNVTSNNPVLIKIDTPPKGDNIKYYSVGATASSGPIPLPPLAPPRIIILKQD
jgi:hypothetical protein